MGLGAWTNKPLKVTRRQPTAAEQAAAGPKPLADDGGGGCQCVPQCYYQYTACGCYCVVNGTQLVFSCYDRYKCYHCDCTYHFEEHYTCYINQICA